jgi:hypothetical protein
MLLAPPPPPPHSSLTSDSDKDLDNMASADVIALISCSRYDLKVN